MAISFEVGVLPLLALTATEETAECVLLSICASARTHARTHIHYVADV